MRAGYVRSHTPIPNQNFNPAFPDSDLNSITAGLGLGCYGGAKFLWLVSCKNTFSKAIKIDLAYLVFLWESRAVTNHSNQNVNGVYKTITHGGSVTFRMQF